MNIKLKWNWVFIQQLYMFFIVVSSSFYYLITIYRLFTLKNEVIQQFLVVTLSVDFIFVLLFFSKIKLFKFEIILFCCLIPSIIIGILTNEPNRRWLTDILIPLLFICKIAIGREFTKKHLMNYKLIGLFKRHANWTFFFVLLGTSIYVLISTIFELDTYTGLEPPVYSTFITFLLNNNYIGSIITILLILYSGKRAIIITLILLIILYGLINGITLKKIIILSVIFMAAIIPLYYFYDDLEKQPAFEKYLNTISIFQDGDQEELDNAGGGRLDEISTILNQMQPYNFVFGKGIGFTYIVGNRPNDEANVEVANAHFSPIGITSKYGLIFYIPFISFYFLLLLTGLNNTKYNNFGLVFSFYYVFAMLIDSMFSYSMFINPLLPFCMGYLSSFMHLKI